MQFSGFPVAVGDAIPKVKGVADLLLQSKEGHGAVREICDKIIEHYRRK